MNTIPNNDATTIRNKGRVLAYFHDQKEWYERHVDVFFMKKVSISDLMLKCQQANLHSFLIIKLNLIESKKG